MTPEDIAAIKAAVAEALKDARVADQAAWITDDSALAMAKAMERVAKEKAEPNEMADEAAVANTPPVPQGDAGDMVPKAELDAALAKLAALEKAAETAQVKADAAPLADAVRRHGLTVDGFDPAAPTAAGNAAAKEALLGVALRGDASTRSPLDIPAGPPPKDGEQAATNTRFAKLA